MKRPFSTIAAILLVLMAALQGVRLWFGWPILIDGMAVPVSASASAIGIGLALAIGLWFEARMHANLAYYNHDAQARNTAPPREAEQTARPFTVRKGARYRATIALAPSEQFARNDTIAALLTDAGFQDVGVTGVGPKRTAEGLWPHSDATATLPVHVVSVTEAAPMIASQPRVQPTAPTPPLQTRAPAPPASASVVAHPPPPADATSAAQRTPAAQPMRVSPSRPAAAADVELNPSDPRSASSVASRFATALAGPKSIPLESTPTPLRPTAATAGAGSVPDVRPTKSPTDAAD